MDFTSVYSTTRDGLYDVLVSASFLKGSQKSSFLLYSEPKTDSSLNYSISLMFVNLYNLNLISQKRCHQCTDIKSFQISDEST